jgi:hypothetical protein
MYGYVTNGTQFAEMSSSLGKFGCIPKTESVKQYDRRIPISDTSVTHYIQKI